MDRQPQNGDPLGFEYTPLEGNRQTPRIHVFQRIKACSPRVCISKVRR